jgi:hypothetical protein
MYRIMGSLWGIRHGLLVMSVIVVGNWNAGAMFGIAQRVIGLLNPRRIKNDFHR